MEAATEWGLLFHQDPACFDSGTEWDMAKRLASIPIAARMIEEAREASGE
jgi:hypothetical protein